MATQIATAELPVIRAAGGIMLRDSPGGDEVMIVFRARHQDWTLPKGKLKDNETFQEAALREVEEETGCRCDLEAYLGMISYAHRGVPKVVMFWRMTVLEEKPRSDGDEITQALWLPITAAIECLTYAQEKALLSHVAAARRSRSVVVSEAESEPESLTATSEPSAAVAETVDPSLVEATSSPVLEVLPAPTLEIVPEPALEIVAPEVEAVPAPAVESVAVEALESLSPSVVTPDPSRDFQDPSPLIDVASYLVDPATSAELQPPSEETLPAPVAVPRPEISHVPGPSRSGRKRRALAHELEGFRVHMAFLATRSQSEESWQAAARQHLESAALCLENKDVEGGWVALRAARRYAVRGLTHAELTARAQLLRDQSFKMLTWRGMGIQRLLAVEDDSVTPARICDAMLLRDEDDAEQVQRERIAAQRLGLLLIVCVAGGAALVSSSYISGAMQYRALLGFLGLLGSVLSAGQQIIRRREAGRIFGAITVIALALIGALAGLAAEPIYQYAARSITLKHSFNLAVYPLAFLLGYAAERSLSYFAGFSREQISVRY